MKNRLIAIGLVLAAVLSWHLRPSSAVNAAGFQQTGTPGQFDFYLLTLSWSPEFCLTHSGAPECALHSTFVMHGLWPQNNDGTWPQNCSSAPGPSNPSQYSDLYPDQSLLQHEWSKHGTCSGLSADDYFSAARKAFQSVKIPSELSGLTTQTSMPPNQILALFTAANSQIQAADMALGCGNNALTAVEVCLDKNFQPTACSRVHSCGATTVQIPPPGAPVHSGHGRHHHVHSPPPQG